MLWPSTCNGTVGHVHCTVHVHECAVHVHECTGVEESHECMPLTAQGVSTFL